MKAEIRKVFVTGGSGFIGREVIGELVGEGISVMALARSQKSEHQLQALGADVVAGDLMHNGAALWQPALAQCDGIIHLAQPKTFGGKITQARAQQYQANRLAMDVHLLSALRGQRMVYVAGTSYYGNQGKHFTDEDAIPSPTGFGPYLVPALGRVARAIGAGNPIMTAFPGYVYGPGSWFEDYVVRPLKKKKALYQVIGSHGRFCSPVSVHDCARALVHLLIHGRPHDRYFIVDDQPITHKTLLTITAKELATRLRFRKIPAPLARLLLGSVVVESFLTNSRLTNWRLKSTGFEFHHPTTHIGIPAELQRMP